MEEAYEVIDAIDSGDPAGHCEELGDLLLQIVFQAQIRKEEGAFCLDDVAQSICDKMTRRHPHVFGTEEAKTAADVRDSWEKIKAREGKGALSGVPRALPALLRAARVTEKASRVGFDWNYSEEVLDKVEEEIRELREAIAGNKDAEVEAELGDLLFTLANFARHRAIDPESALRTTIERFSKRFDHVETSLRKRGVNAGDATPEELEALWEEAKRSE
jgi:tetrapyrrole methylase family protein/MazG family protein